MAEDFVRLRLTRAQAREVFDAVDDDDDPVTFQGSINGQPIAVRIGPGSAVAEDEDEDVDVELARLEAEFAASGGRGVDLAERIDALRVRISANDAPAGATGAVTEDEALSLTHTFRSRFDWSGTDFMRSDVTEAVRNAWTVKNPTTPLTPERESELVEVVMGSYSYRKLADRFAELGNQLIGDAAESAVSGDDPEWV